MTLPNDNAHCAGTGCPSARYCARFTHQPKGSNDIVFAAFWARRAPHEISCDSMIQYSAPVLDQEAA